MTLQNLLKIGQLVEHATDKKQVGKLLVAAESLQGCLTRWMAKNKPELLP